MYDNRTIISRLELHHRGPSAMSSLDLCRSEVVRMKFWVMGCLGVSEEEKISPLLHHLPVLHDGYMVADLFHHGHFVCDHHNGQVQLLVQIL